MCSKTSVFGVKKIIIIAILFLLFSCNGEEDNTKIEKKYYLEKEKLIEIQCTKDSDCVLTKKLAEPICGTVLSIRKNFSNNDINMANKIIIEDHKKDRILYDCSRPPKIDDLDAVCNKERNICDYVIKKTFWFKF